MDSNTLQIILLFVQFITLFALVITTYRATETAKANQKSADTANKVLLEMQETRDDETAPYIVVYFDMPNDKPLIYLVVKNIGKTVAKDVKFEFTPHLQNKLYEINSLSLIKDGIKSLPPNFEIKTLFDSAISVYGNKNSTPLTYDVKVRYFGGLRSVARTNDQVLDLTVFKNLHYTTSKGLDDVVKSLDNLVDSQKKAAQSLEQIQGYLGSGVWIRNTETHTIGSWSHQMLAKLKEFVWVWQTVKNGEDEASIDLSLDYIQTRAFLSGEEILAIAGRALDSELEDSTKAISQIALKLFQIGKMTMYIDGGQSFDKLITLGDSVVSDIETLLPSLTDDSNLL